MSLYEPVPSLWACTISLCTASFPFPGMTAVWPFTSLTWKQQICEKELWEALTDSYPSKWGAASASLGVTLSYPLAWQSRLFMLLPGKTLLPSPVTAFTYSVEICVWHQQKCALFVPVGPHRTTFEVDHHWLFFSIFQLLRLKAMHLKDCRLY